MIRRVSDNNINNNFDTLSKIIEKQSKTCVVDIVDKEEQALTIKKQLKVEGYNCEIRKMGNKYKVIAIAPEKIKLTEALSTNGFEKLAWGRYCFQKENALGMFKYDYDDGSIWRVISGDDGNEYLVKEINDENEDEVVRTKSASENNDKIVDDCNVKSVIKTLYNNYNDNEILNDLLSSPVKKEIYNFLNKKLKNKIASIIQQNHFIQSPEYINDVTTIVKTAINNKNINSSKSLNKVIKDYTENETTKTAKYKMEKIFD